jgi:hypothetical protein
MNGDEEDEEAIQWRSTPEAPSLAGDDLLWGR